MRVIAGPCGRAGLAACLVVSAIVLRPQAAAEAAEAPADLAVAAAAARVQALEAELEAARQDHVAARLAEQEAKAKAPPPVTTPQIVVPRLAQAPVIDGVIGAAEWAGAVVYPAGTGASNQGQPMRAREASVFFVAWDAENLYIAQRMPMREGETPVRLNRAPKHDLMDPWETVVEAYIDRKGNGSNGLPCRYQFIGNACGNRWDREDQYSIGQNMVSWDGEWSYAQRATPDGKYWESEMAFPRRTVYQAEPLKDGDRWQIGLAASLQHPWQWSGFYGWPITAIFREAAPAIRVTRPQRGVLGKRLTFDVEIANTLPRPLAVRVVARLWDPAAKPEPKTVVEKEVPVSLQPGETFRQAIDEAADQAEDGRTYAYTLMVLEGEASLYTWSLGVRYNDPENTVGLKVETSKAPFQLAARYYPLSNLLKVSVDKYDLPSRDEVKRARFSVRPAAGGAALGQGEVSVFSYEKGDAVLALPADLKPGTYVCEASLLDAQGQVLATHQVTFARQDHAKEFPWLGTRVGDEDVLPRVFAPVEVKDGVLCGYRKEIRLDGTALPVSIRAADIELLAGPVVVRGTAGGQPFTVQPATHTPPRPGTLSRTQLNYTGRGTGGPLAVETNYRLDYDGTARIELTLKPAGNAPAKLDALQLVVPFRGEAATHFMVNGFNMRASNRAGRLPAAGPKPDAPLWVSTDMPAQKMTVGSFVPIVHLGNLTSGLTWFADSDGGWWPTDKAPAIAIVRTPQNTVELVCNLAAEPVELAAPRRLVFGLCTVPVRAVTPYRSTAHTIGFGFEKESGRWDPKKTPERIYARVYPDNPEQFRRWVDDLHARGQLEKAYIENSSADFWSHEFAYFAPEWESMFARSAADCKLWWTDRFVRDTGLDGYYVDNLFCRTQVDPDVGSAYRLPDGRVQPGYDLWNCRDYFRRIRIVFEKYRDPTAIVFHNTDFQFAPVMGYADLVMGGENPLPSKGTPDFMDMWPRDWMDVMCNQPLWGYSLSHLFHFPWASFTDELGEYDAKAAWKAFRTMQASMLVHGVEFFHGIEYRGNLMGRFRLFKKLPGPAEFIPRWQAAGRFRVEGTDPDLDVALWRQDGALLFVVANYGKQGKWAEVWCDFPALLPPPAKHEVRGLYDLETMESPGFIVKEGGWPNGTLQPNVLRFKIEPRDFRAFLLVNEPVAQGAGF